MPEVTCFADKLENEVSYFFHVPPHPPQGHMGGGVPLPSECHERAPTHRATLRHFAALGEGSWGTGRVAEYPPVAPSGFWSPAGTGPTPPCKPQVCLSESDRTAGLGLKEGPECHLTFHGHCDCTKAGVHSPSRGARGGLGCTDRVDEGLQLRLCDLPAITGLAGKGAGLKASSCLSGQGSQHATGWHSWRNPSPPRHTSFSESGSSAEAGQFFRLSCINDQTLTSWEGPGEARFLLEGKGSEFSLSLGLVRH